MSKRNAKATILWLGLVVWLAACGAQPAVIPSAGSTETPVRLSGVRISTLTPLPTATSMPATPTPPAPPTSAPVAAATSTPGCIVAASFVADVTIPDGSTVDANSELVKTWRIKNSGSCGWGSGLTAVHVDGDSLGGPASFSIPAMGVGSTRDVSISLRAPANAGTYKGKWQVRTSSGVALSGLTVSIVVVANTPTPTPAPTKPAKATPVPTFSGSLASFSGWWLVVPDKFGGNMTDTHRLQQLQVDVQGYKLAVSPAADFGSPYEFGVTSSVLTSYPGSDTVQWEFDDPLRGHVTIKMQIKKACNAHVRLTYPGFDGTFIVQNERSEIPCM